MWPPPAMELSAMAARASAEAGETSAAEDRASGPLTMLLIFDKRWRGLCVVQTGVKEPYRREGGSPVCQLNVVVSAQPWGRE